MARLYLRAKDKNHAPGDWELILGKGRGQLTDPQGIIEADFDLEEAHKRFQLPSFWLSIKDLGVNSDTEQVIWFVPDREAVAEIKSYLAYALAQQGEGAIASTRWKGWALILGGIALLAVAAGFLVLIIVQAANPPANQNWQRYRFGAPIFGLCFGGYLIWAGISSLARARVAETEWNTDEAEEEFDVEED